VQDFRELKVWQKAHELALVVYKATAGFPPVERYGLTSQMRRAAVSIPANIAEGCCRSGDTEFSRFLEIAMGSASEIAYYVILTRDLGLIDAEMQQCLADGVNEVQRMLALLIRRLRNRVKIT